ncbi:hypothetical protein [Thermococcus sp. MV11]|uniref:hypothetical protein n=1 Tax=Thermococcus sp. MV11 TaxID=1638267 RepID=UPI001431A2CB|nr:hypothetical protein [Thermococcus sp. MV11]NJE04384.1 hypothetical protein [Thermococcus sp. MV11]
MKGSKKPKLHFFIFLLIALVVIATLSIPYFREKGTPIYNNQTLGPQECGQECRLTIHSKQPENALIGGWIDKRITEVTNGSEITLDDWFVVYPHMNLTSPPEGWNAYLIHWPEKFNLTVPCSMGGFTMALVGRESGQSFYQAVLRNETPTKHARDCWGEGNGRWLELPPGKAYFAVQYIPTANATWKLTVLTPTRTWTDFRDYHIFFETPVKLEATCTCPIETLVERFEASIKAQGFEETELWTVPRENDCFKPLSIKLYRRGDEYLYVEFARVKGLDLVRVLMVLGEDEGVVKAYAEAFSAGNVEG